MLLITIKEVAEIQDAPLCAETYWQILPLFACLSCWRPWFDGHVGHSLGAGVASLAAPWAALQWPGADIRCVTFGNPKPGNQAYSDVSHNLFPPVSCHGLTVLTTQAVFCLLASYLH